jgi:hypothetical protein
MQQVKAQRLTAAHASEHLGGTWVAHMFSTAQRCR